MGFDIHATMTKGVLHGYKEETPEAKAQWFRSLPLSERMELLCAFTDLVLAVNPKITDRN